MVKYAPLAIMLVPLLICGCLPGMLTLKDVEFIRKDNELIRAYVPVASECISRSRSFDKEVKERLLEYGEEILKNRDAWDVKIGEEPNG